MKNKPIKLRKTWAINPRVRVKKSKKIYSRQKAKQESRRTISNDPFDCAGGSS